MTNRMQGKIAFITGAASDGIGRAAARLFAEEQAKVAIADISRAGGEETVSLIKEAGGDAVFVETDVTKPTSVQKAIRAVVEHYGHINVLYNNAGGSRPEDGLITEISVEAWQKTMSIDLFGTFLCCKYGIPELILSGGGAVVNTSSQFALVGRHKGAYTAAKGAVIALSRMMAVHYAKQNIRVNVICPGLTLTERVKREVLTVPDNARVTEHDSLVGSIEPLDIAKAALYLASDESRRVTGVVFPVDSGATTQ